MRTPDSPSRNVTFRLSADEYDLLDGHSKEVGVSPAMHAREIVRAGIHQWGHAQELRAMAQDLVGVRGSLETQRAHLRRIAIALLVAHGMSADDSRSWAEKNLGAKSGEASE